MLGFEAPFSKVLADWLAGYILRETLNMIGAIIFHG